MTESSYVQYGCGHSAPEGWRNFDASPTLRFERIPLIGKLYTKNANRFPDAVEYGDIVKGLPLPAGSCDGIYCSHVLEHLSFNDLRAALKNTHTVLKPGAIFRLVLPDLEQYIRTYVDNPSHEAAPNFMRQALLGVERRPRGLQGFMAVCFGNYRHLWMWDYLALEAELKDAGFTDIRRASLGDSADAKFSTIEHPDRWHDCLGIECRRPA
ncbi:MAG: methyltransferase domain-containing protein [Phycisphaeraceae bacterium]